MQLIAFHLPQFHPIPENDAWWGKGFTEWTNVAKARPVVPGHYQPHLPADLGFYDLRLPEARAAQAELAREYGITGFCYYHYWFTGKQVLERPVNDILASGEPDFPFCLCWANEDWTRAWDGRSGHRLLEQQYSEEDDKAHIESLLPILKDPRYIRIGGRPLLLVYRTELIPDPEKTARTWREAATNAGVGDLFLARVESFRTDIDPESIGFDAAVEFAPDWRQVKRKQFGLMKKVLSKLRLFPRGYFVHRFADFASLANEMLAKPDPGFRRYRCVTPGFDNSPRRETDATILTDNKPEVYGDWLEQTLRGEQKTSHAEDEKIVFVNAWNEWAEGNHLEPDRKFGRAFLEATRDALRRAGVLKS